MGRKALQAAETSIHGPFAPEDAFMDAPKRWTPPEPLPVPLETDRLVLRWFESGDGQALHEAVDPFRDKLLPWLPWAEKDHEDVEASSFRIGWFEERRGPDDDAIPDYTIGIFEKSSGQLLGGTGLHRVIPEASDAEVGYWLRADRWGEGFCTEATQAIITSGFRDWGFRRIRIICSAANVPSRKVPERLGIRLEGTERENLWVDGLGWTDKLTYGVLDKEWDAEAGQVWARSAER